MDRTSPATLPSPSATRAATRQTHGCRCHRCRHRRRALEALINGDLAERELRLQAPPTTVPISGRVYQIQRGRGGVSRSAGVQSGREQRPTARSAKIDELREFDMPDDEWDELDEILFGTGRVEAENDLEEEFRLSKFPPSVREAFRQARNAPILWPTVMQAAIDAGITDANVLANLAFYLHHPEMLTGTDEGRPISPSDPNFRALSELWKFLHEAARNLLRSGPTPGSSRQPPEKPKLEPPSGASRLAEMLNMVRIDSLGGSSAERLQLEKLKAFLIYALNGGQVDDRYWQYTIFDGLGRKRPCSFTGSIAGVERGTRPQRAVANFQRSCRTASRLQEVGRCLKEVHDAVLCHTNALLGWALHNATMGDAAIRNYTECAYLLEAEAASLRTAPKSIYSCFAPLFRNVRKVCT